MQVTFGRISFHDMICDCTAGVDGDVPVLNSDGLVVLLNIRVDSDIA